MRKLDINRIKAGTVSNNQIVAYSNVTGGFVSTSNAVLDNITVNANLTVNGTVTFSGSLAGIPAGNSSTAGILKIVDSTSNTSATIAASANAVASLSTSKADKASPTFTGTLSAADVTITGNLTVSGNTTYINTTELNIGDNLIVLNADLPGGTAPTQNAGIVINRGSSTNVSIYWDETNDYFETTDGLSVIGDVVSSNVVYAEYVTANQGIFSYAGLTANGDVVANNLSATYLITATDASISNTITIGSATVNSSAYTGTANSTTYFGGQLAAYYTNATNIATGTVPTARLPASNTSQAGVVQMVDSTGNTSVTIAATANSVKTAYDMAITANTNAAAAYSNAYNDAVALAGNAYSNAVVLAANATNITSGTLDTARLPATANVTTAINVGANINVTTSSIKVGNSTVNTTMNASTFAVGSAYTVNSTAIAMATGALTINTVSASGTLAVGSNVTVNTSAIVIGNASVYTLIGSDHIHANGTYITSVDAATVGGNTATTLLAASDTAYTNAVSVAAADATSKANAAYTNAVSVASTDATNKAATAYSNAIAYSGNAALAFANAVSTAAADATSKADAAFANAIATSNASQAYANAIAYSGNAALAYANAVTFATTKADDAYANAISYSGNAALAYANAAAFSANADNIASGTLNTARLPATVNVATAFNVGANVKITTSAVRVGNATSNVEVISTGIVFPDSSLQTSAPIGGSSNTQVLFNDRGNSNGAVGLTFVYTTNTLTVANTINSNNITVNTVTTNVISGSNVTSTGNVNVTNTLRLGSNGVMFSDGSTMTTAALDPIAYAIALG